MRNCHCDLACDLSQKLEKVKIVIVTDPTGYIFGMVYRLFPCKFQHKIESPKRTHLTYSENDVHLLYLKRTGVK